MPALALAGARLVVIPLVPLTGAVLAYLSVTAMAGLGGGVMTWFSALSVLSAIVVTWRWWRHPDSRLWIRDKDRAPARTLCAIALGAGLTVGAFGLSILKAPWTGFDARAIWMLHPEWYVQGHAVTVATLRNPALAFSNPSYPPLVGGSVALSWILSGDETDRLGVVMVGLLNAFAILAAASSMVELARRLASSTDGDKRRRLVILGVGVATAVVLMVVVFRVGFPFVANGYADVLWSTAAVGAVAYGLVLPCQSANMGAALILAAVAGATKLEGSYTAIVIVGLITARALFHDRAKGRFQHWRARLTAGIATWFVIGAWPSVARILGAIPDKPNAGRRVGDDLARLHVSLAGSWSEMHLLGVAVPVAVLGVLCLSGARRKAALGHDGWAWSALITELAIVTAAYVVGPGDIATWVRHSIDRTTMFPVLEAWWLTATWGIIAVSEIRLVRGHDSSDREWSPSPGVLPTQGGPSTLPPVLC